MTQANKKGLFQEHNVEISSSQNAEQGTRRAHLGGKTGNQMLSGSITGLHGMRTLTRSVNMTVADF